MKKNENITWSTQRTRIIDYKQLCVSGAPTDNPQMIKNLRLQLLLTLC